MATKDSQFPFGLRAQGRGLPLLLLPTAPSRCWGSILLLAWKPNCAICPRPLGIRGVISSLPFSHSCQVLRKLHYSPGASRRSGQTILPASLGSPLSLWSPYTRSWRLAAKPSLSMLPFLLPNPSCLCRYITSPSHPELSSTLTPGHTEY